MPTEPHAGAWGALLGACKLNGNIEFGELVANQLFEIEPLNPGNYVLLSNIYVAADHWFDVSAVRDKMEEQGIKKIRGRVFLDPNLLISSLQDVNDVLVAIDHVIDLGLASPSKLAVLGGSRGGFLTTHLIGQAQDKFIAAAARNPVCNLALMVGTTDIPDWRYAEAYGSEGQNSFTDAHVSKVKTSTLFLLGAQDLRVPVSTGLQTIGQDSETEHLKLTITLLHGKHGPQACEQSGKLDPNGKSQAGNLRGLQETSTSS
ncbi:hypothetical protein ACE6H2_026404 [Prunus campanulata]